MDEQAAQGLINAELARLQKLSFADLTASIGKPETNQHVGDDGKTYQIEIQHSGTAKKAQTCE